MPNNVEDYQIVIYGETQDPTGVGQKAETLVDSFDTLSVTKWIVISGANYVSSGYVPSNGTAYVGVSTGGTGANYDAFLTAAGVSRLALYNRWTEPNASFDWILNEFATRPVTGMISWNLPGDGTQASIASGAWDSNIQARATEAHAYGMPLFIRPNWEMNGFWYDWSARNADGSVRAGNSPADYVAAWRRIVSLFANVPNATFVWCPTLFEPVPTGYGLTDWDWYPGDNYVGWVGVDAYPGSANWDFMQNGPQALNEFDSFATQHGKPLMIAEWALNTVGTGDSVTWMSQFVQWMASHTSVKAQLYFDYDNTVSEGKDYRLTTFPNAAADYNTALNNSRWLTEVVP